MIEASVGRVHFLAPLLKECIWDLLPIWMGKQIIQRSTRKILFYYYYCFRIKYILLKLVFRAFHSLIIIYSLLTSLRFLNPLLEKTTFVYALPSPFPSTDLTLNKAFLKFPTSNYHYIFSTPPLHWRNENDKISLGVFQEKMK